MTMNHIWTEDPSFDDVPKPVSLIVMKPSVYLETSVISYLTGRPSRDLIVAGHQQITSEWWVKVLPSVDVFVSELVLDEAARGDGDAAAQRLARIESMPLLEAVDEVDGLARVYADALGLPEKALADAYHMALATWHGMDYVVSWNCKHIASGRVQRVLMDANDTMDLQTPILCTPEELMEV
ncbi:MAG: type II toxin-antitoxin system VapC family toxin [Verrucomicrobia bacterium]|jgi:predicted nucleic acid-binding protein|nr:type II toxin-antitoxin system VapC family toxin [Verrucomicrobiota bacterium]